MKRLLTPYPPRWERGGIPDEEGWRAYADRLGSHRIKPALVHSILRRATLGRVLFEDWLEARRDPDSRSRLRRSRRAADRELELVRLLRENSPSGGSLVSEVEAVVREHRRRLRTPTSTDRRSPRGRLGEPWAEAAILEMTALFHRRGLTWDRTIKEAHAGLVLFGHGDVVSIHQVDHALRRARRRDPGFGARSSASRPGPVKR